MLLLAADLLQSLTVLFVTPCRLCKHSRAQKVLNATGGCCARSLGRNARSLGDSSLLALLPEAAWACFTQFLFLVFAAQSCNVRALNLSHLFPLQPQRSVARYRPLQGGHEPGAQPLRQSRWPLGRWGSASSPSPALPL